MNTETVLIKNVEHKEGSEFVHYWKKPVDVVTTNLGSFLADPAQNDFSPLISKELEVWFNDSTGYTWISFITSSIIGRTLSGRFIPFIPRCPVKIISEYSNL